jgi:tetratricopeptide (TPR) repeat protein
MICAIQGYNLAHLRMVDPLREYEGSDSRIEELLLAGLDHYFNGQHEQAINVWTRVLFLDRAHARARAYIERARTAVAERQREGDELLHAGLAAFARGDAGDARRLLTSAIERGARPEEAMAVLERLERIGPPPQPVAPRPRASHGGMLVAERRGISAATLLLVLAIGLASGAVAMMAWSSGVLPWGQAPLPAADVRATPDPLPVPSASEVSLARATAWYRSGRLRDALAALDAIRPGDPLRPRADDLRATIQQKLLEAARATRPAPRSDSAR